MGMIRSTRHGLMKGLRTMKVAIGKNGVNAEIASPITILVIGLFSLLVGCGKGVESLLQDFSKHKLQLNELKVLMLSLKTSSGIRGYVTRMGDETDLLFTGEGQKIPMDRISSENQSKVGRVKEIVHQIKGDSVHVLDQDTLWVVMDSGGVLAADAGYTSYDSVPPFPAGDKAKYFPVSGEKEWYVFVR